MQSQQAKRETAVQIARLLAHYWTTHEPEAVRRMVAEDWLDDLAEFAPEIVTAACREWRRQPGGRRPTPGDIRGLCIAEQHARAELRALTDTRAARWPGWLAELWGPEPDGPARRAEAIRTGVLHTEAPPAPPPREGNYTYTLRKGF